MIDIAKIEKREWSKDTTIAFFIAKMAIVQMISLKVGNDFFTPVITTVILIVEEALIFWKIFRIYKQDKIYNNLLKNGVLDYAYYDKFKSSIIIKTGNGKGYHLNLRFNSPRGIYYTQADISNENEMNAFEKVLENDKIPVLTDYNGRYEVLLFKVSEDHDFSYLNEHKNSKYVNKTVIAIKIMFIIAGILYWFAS